MVHGFRFELLLRHCSRFELSQDFLKDAWLATEERRDEFSF